MKNYCSLARPLAFFVLSFSSFSCCMERASDYSPLLRAIREKNALAVKGVLITRQDAATLSQALMTAAIYGNAPIIRLLLGTGVNANCINIDGNTPLHLALLYNNTETAKALITGEREEISDPDACCVAKACKALSCRQYTKARIDLKNNQGDTPIHIATRNNNVEILRAFPQDFIRILQNKAGQTALHIAAQQNNRPLVEVLVSQMNADPVAIDATGRMPANVTSNTAIAEYLRKAVVVELLQLRQNVRNLQDELNNAKDGGGSRWSGDGDGDY
jgi:ankyrin repeat protein